MNFSMKIIKPLISYSLLALSVFTTQVSIAKDVAAGIFLKIEPFAEYGFNKSHAAAYAKSEPASDGRRWHRRRGRPGRSRCSERRGCRKLEPGKHLAGFGGSAGTDRPVRCPDQSPGASVPRRRTPHI